MVENHAFRSCILLAFVLFAVGCTSTQHVQVNTLDDPPPEAPAHEATDKDDVKGLSADEVQEELEGTTAHITLRDGQVVESAHRLRLTADSLSFMIGDDQYQHTVAVHTVREVRVKRRGRGTLEGLGLGLVGGIVVGAIGGRITASEGDFFGSEAQTVFGGLTGGVVGLPLGGIIGLIRGHRRVYQFRP